MSLAHCRGVHMHAVVSPSWHCLAARTRGVSHDGIGLNQKPFGPRAHQRVEEGCLLAWRAASLACGCRAHDVVVDCGCQPDGQALQHLSESWGCSFCIQVYVHLKLQVGFKHHLLIMSPKCHLLKGGSSRARCKADLCSPLQ